MTPGMLALLRDTYPFLVGAAFGAAFGALGLPLPAPPTLPAAFGVVGVTAGYLWVKLCLCS
jgi:XapX domain-containing protein